MEQRYSWSWVEARVDESIGIWNRCAVDSIPSFPRYTRNEQRISEKAYDRALRAVEREARQARRTPASLFLARQRIVALFPRFAAVALGLETEAVQLLTGGFLPVGAQLARWARNFDASLGMEDTIQACRNAWTACGLQALLGQPMELTPSILAYSLLYPLSDNYLDHPELPASRKLEFSERFRQRLCGQRLPASNAREAAVWAMVQLIEDQYPRSTCPQVFDCLLAIHLAQERSIVQLGNAGHLDDSLAAIDVLRISCAKGGTSVLADACLAQPSLNPQESEFSFLWGVLLQLGDDLQDVDEDLRRGSVTLYSRAAAEGRPLDGLVLQLLHLSQRVAERMDRLPHGSPSLKNLLRMSWRSLILMAVADNHRYFSPAFLAQLEPCSSFRFEFLRERNRKPIERRDLYATLFDAFLEAGPDDGSELPLPEESRPAPDLRPAAELRAMSSSFA